MKNTSREYFAALVLAMLFVLVIGKFTNSMPPRWDALNYVDMAKNGIVANNNLVAPFAYRPGMPLLARGLAFLLAIPIERGFQLASWLCAILLLFSVFVLAKHISADFVASILTQMFVGLIGMHIKLPLFFYSMVDVSGYFFAVISFWALLKRKYVLCLLISAIGMFFKEFLAIPLILLLFCLTRDYFKLRSKKILALLTIAAVVTLSVIAVPRLLIQVQHSEQEVDPLNDPGSLKKIVTIPLKKARDVNVLLALLSYWLPTLLLITKQRARNLWHKWGAFKTIFTIYFVLNLFLVVYGGTNVMFFVSYMLPLQVVVITSLLKRNVQGWEICYIILVLIFFFKIFQAIPLPEFDFDKYIDFYGGWGSRLNLASVFRFLQIVFFISLANGLRLGIQRFGKQPDGNRV